MSEPVLRVEGLTKAFRDRRNALDVLQDVSLHIERGEFVSIVGPSGSGKSTLFNLIAGIETPDSGSIAVQGETDPDARRLRCGYMFQKDLLFAWRTVVDNAALGLEVARGISRQVARERVHGLLPRFGLEGFGEHHPSQLSGGMRQRAALLRTVLLERPLLLLDEPFASLDALTRRELQGWLRDTWRDGSDAALLVTHDVREAIALSDRVYVLSPRPGSIVAEINTRTARESGDAALSAEAELRVLAALGAATPA